MINDYNRYLHWDNESISYNFWSLETKNNDGPTMMYNIKTPQNFEKLYVVKLNFFHLF